MSRTAGSVDRERRRVGREPRRVRCARCLDVVWVDNPWGSATCRCGSVTVSGVPWRPKVGWLADGAGGWSYAEENGETEVGDGGPRIGY